MKIPVTYPYDSVVEFPDDCDIYISIDKDKKNTICLEYMELDDLESQYLYLSYKDKSEMEIIYKLLMRNLQLN